MKFNDRIFWIGIVVVLVLNKAYEMAASFDMAINPAESIAKIIVMFALTYELIRTLLPKAKAC